MICINCGRPIGNKVCDYCGTDYRSDEEKNKIECNHIYGSVMCEENPRDMFVNLIFKCENCNQTMKLRVTRSFFYSMIGLR